MAKCQVCGKHPRTGMQLSHSHKRTKRTWAPNIKKVKADLNGTVRRVSVCTRCLRSGKIQRAK